MSSLREIKDRIGSVRSTLKITGAMKLVASAKLRKAQQAAQGLRAYETTMSDIIADLRFRPKSQVPQDFETGVRSFSAENDSRRIAVVAIASNSSLCGAFNGNIVRRTLKLLSELESEVAATEGRREAGAASDPVRGSAAHPSQVGAWAPPFNVAEGGTPLGGGTNIPAVDVFPIGRRIADPLRRLGYPAEAQSLNELVAHPSYDAAVDLADSLAEAVRNGKYSRVVLVYNHFVSASRQEVRCETFLPYETGNLTAREEQEKSFETDYIVEPSASQILETMLPQLIRLKLYATILDSIAAEHAARMIAMQTATDNAQDLLDELTLEYNKGRQQQITAEILDIVGGSQQ